MEALEHLDRALARDGVRAELYLVGGAVMCIAINARASTKDEDGWFTQPQAVRAAARQVAIELGLPDDWLNDAAKGFIRLWGLGQQTQAQLQLLKGGKGFDLPGLLKN